MTKIKLYNGEALEIMDKLISEGVVVDAIITDPPYGTMKGIDKSSALNYENHDWDVSIEPTELYKRFEQILKKNGRIVLFSQEPYSTNLITKSTPSINFKYRMIYLKNHFGNCLGSKKAPVSYYEDILVFNKDLDNIETSNKVEELDELRQYAKQVREYIGVSYKELRERMETHGFMSFYTYYKLKNGFNIPSEKNYNLLIQIYKLFNMEGFKEYSELLELKKKTQEQPATFNLWNGKLSKSNIFEYNKPHRTIHPTQKPILLMEDLIETFTNEGDIVLDFTMGSGSTGVACQNTNRKFIGIEMNEEFFNKASERIKKNITEKE